MSINKVILLGNVGQEPTITNLENGNKVARFALATTERGFTTKDGKEVAEQTDWHNLVLWRGLANLAEQYITKGSKICVVGKLKTRSYDDKEGNKKYVTEVVVEEIELCGAKLTENSTISDVPSQSKSTPKTPIKQSPIEEESPVGDDLPF